MKTSLRQGFLLLSATSALVSVVATAQTPWIVTVAPTMNPLPAGVCTAVKFSVADAAGAIPRNPDGSRILQSDFDLTVTASNPASVVGMYSGSNNWAACVCQGAAAGSVATITATYPSQALAESMRVGRVPAKASATFVTAKPMGPINPAGCQSASLRVIAETRPLAVTVSPITTSVIAKVPVVAPSAPLSSPSVAPPTNVISPAPISATDTKVPLAASSPTVVAASPPAATSTGVKTPLAAPPAPPAPPVTSAPDMTNPSKFTAVQTGKGKVLLSWEPVRYTSYYVLFGPGLPQGGVRIGGGTGPLASGQSSAVATGGVSIDATAFNVPPGNQEWAVGSYYDPGGVSTAAADFSRVALKVVLTEPINPPDLSAMQIATGVIRLSWQPVNGVSYYRLYGAGLPTGGVKVEQPDGVSSSIATSQSIAYTATAVPAGLRLWRVGSFLDPGAVSTDSSTFPKASLNVAEQVPGNPVGFTAVQIRPGAVRLSWKLMNGATYYMLSGDGLAPGGQKVVTPVFLSAPNTPPPDSVTWSITDLPAGMHSWKVGSFRDPGAISGDPATFSAVSLNVAAPVVNPSGFTAIQMNPGVVRLTWQAVGGASYYELRGPGLPQGLARIGGNVAGVSGTAGTTVASPEFTAIAVPSGPQEWTVGSFFEPGPVSTPVAEFPRAGLNVNPPENPEGFAAIQTGSGQVKLSWQAVTGASYYMLTGTGLPSAGIKVQPALAGGGNAVGGILRDLEFVANGIPAGRGRWQVGSYFMPGAISTSLAEFSTATLTVTLQMP